MVSKAIRLPEIDELHHQSSTNEDISRFEVQMGDLLQMEEIEAFRYLLHHHQLLVQRKMLHFGEIVF